MKLPNGFGGITKLSGKRRNPYRVRITKGWSNEGKQLYITLGYYHTRENALTALSNYNENPYDINSNSITFSEVYEKWSTEHFEEIVLSAQRNWKCAYSYCTQLYNMRFKDIKVEHLEGTIKNADVGQATKQRIKSLFNLLFKYAMKHEICDKDYAQLCNPIKDGKPQIIRIPFNYEEIQTLWDNINIPFVDMILIELYTGWRPQELAILKCKDIDLENLIIKGGLKTEAGKNRIVPIHSKIQELIQNRISDKEYLFYDNNSFYNNNEYAINTYERYYGRFMKVMEKLNMKHMPHDTRHTFITECKEKNVNEYIIKLLVGHSIKDITEKVYTHREIEDLKKGIEKLTYKK